MAAPWGEGFSYLFEKELAPTAGLLVLFLAIRWFGPSMTDLQQAEAAFAIWAGSMLLGVRHRQFEITELIDRERSEDRREEYKALAAALRSIETEVATVQSEVSQLEFEIVERLRTRFDEITSLLEDYRHPPL